MTKQKNSWGTILYHAQSQQDLAFSCKNTLGIQICDIPSVAAL